MYDKGIDSQARHCAVGYQVRQIQSGRSERDELTRE